MSVAAGVVLTSFHFKNQQNMQFAKGFPKRLRDSDKCRNLDIFISFSGHDVAMM